GSSMTAEDSGPEGPLPWEANPERDPGFGQQHHLSAFSSPSPLFPFPWSRLSPAAADPNVAMVVMRPMASHPHGSVPWTACITAAYPDPDPAVPIPIAGHPDICGAGSYPNSFHLDSGRSHRGYYYRPGRWEISRALRRWRRLCWPS